MDNPDSLKKADAIRQLGGTQTAAARRMGISCAAVSKWPDPLPQRIADRVRGVLARGALRKAHRRGNSRAALAVSDVKGV